MLRGRVRRAAGRDAEPTAAILDSQTVKTSGNVPESTQGIDAGKRIKGRKRHVATDVLGLLLVVQVTAASVHDTVAGRDLVDEVGITSAGGGHHLGRLRLPTQRRRPRRRARYRRAGGDKGLAAERVRLATQEVGGRTHVVRREALCCIPGSAGRDSKGGSWV